MDCWILDGLESRTGRRWLFFTGFCH